MNKAEKVYLWLSTFDFLHHKRLEALINIFDEKIEQIFDKFETKKDLIIEVLGTEANYNKMLFARSDEYIENYIKNLKNSNIEVVTRASNNFPKRLMEIDNPPYVLYCKGDLALLDVEGIAIVGTRKPTAYGRSVTELFSKALAKNNFLIISGMASGIDSIAHRSALEQGKKTIAVLGGGFNYIYPASNNELSRQIAENGLLVSEYKPSFQPKSYTFIERNRIIAGLSKAVLIPEAGVASGSMHTKNFALDSGREVFAIPGPINNPMSEGTNGIIKRGNGVCVTEPDDILKYYEIETNPIKPQKLPQLSVDEMLIYQVLQDDESDFETLQEKTNLDTKILNSCLTSLQINGLIKKLPGNKYTI